MMCTKGPTHRDELFELKAIGYVRSWYPTYGNQATSQNKDPARACDRRALKVHDDYVRHAKLLDNVRGAGVKNHRKSAMREWQTYTRVHLQLQSAIRPDVRTLSPDEEFAALADAERELE